MNQKVQVSKRSPANTMFVELLIIENHSPNPSPIRRGVPKAGSGLNGIMGN